MTVKLDTLEDSDYTEDESGPTLTRAGMISGLSGVAKDRWLWAARTLAGVPAYGEYHPVVPGARALRFTIKPINNDSARLVIVYSRPAGAEQTPAGQDPASVNDVQIRVGATVIQVETQRDRNGRPLAVEYRAVERDSSGNVLRTIAPEVGSLVPEGADRSGTVWVEGRQIHAANVDAPQGVLIFTRREDRPPLAKSLAFSGAVNAARIWRGAPRTWLCTGIEGQSDDGGSTYLVDYSFSFNPDTWDQDIVWIDPETGAPHKDIDFEQVEPPSGKPTGVWRHQIRQTADFSQLYLPEIGL